MDDPSELFTKREYENGTELQTEMGATTAHLGKTILKPTAMNSNLMPNVNSNWKAKAAMAARICIVEHSTGEAAAARDDGQPA